MKLSIIIPVYNEEKTIAAVLQRVNDLKIDNVEKEIIVVDDGSNDSSKLKVSAFAKAMAGKQSSKLFKQVKFYAHKKNMGKAAAIKTAIEHATGEYVVIQDADTEYNPEDIKKLVAQLQNKSDVVYGTRLNRFPDFRGDLGKGLFIVHYLGNRLLSLVTSALYGQWLTDMETCYKLFPRSAVEHIHLHAKGFAFEPEITAKLLKAGYTIKEISITTTPRDYVEGKKLQAWRDGPIALWTLLKYRFVD